MTMEMDLGWVTVGGGNPIELLHRYGNRISMLHVKDFKPFKVPQSIENPPTATALGQGSIDYRPFSRPPQRPDTSNTALSAEEYNMPVMQELKIDAEYMRKLHA